MGRGKAPPPDRIRGRRRTTLRPWSEDPTRGTRSTSVFHLMPVTLPAGEPAVPPVVDVAVPVGGRVMVVSDVHLTAEPGPGETAALAELTAALGSWVGPGVAILNGNTLEAAVAHDGASGAVSGPAPGRDGPRMTAPALAAHPRFVAAVSGFASGPGRRVVVLPGDRDAHLAWSPACATAVSRTLGATVALSAELTIETGTGVRRVRIEPGHRLDALARLDDPCNPGESPLASHLRQEVFPAVRRNESGRNGRDDWLAGMEHLDDPAAFPRFLASRLAYRKLGRRAWLLLVPVLVAVALRLPALALAHATGLAHGASARLVLLVLATVVELVLLAAVAVGSLRRTWRALASLSLGEVDREPNRKARDLARSLVTDGYAGLVTGHTCRPRLLRQLGMQRGGRQRGHDPLRRPGSASGVRRFAAGDMGRARSRQRAARAPAARRPTPG
jgi:hypothetical protein